MIHEIADNFHPTNYKNMMKISAMTFLIAFS